MYNAKIPTSVCSLERLSILQYSLTDHGEFIAVSMPRSRTSLITSSPSDLLGLFKFPSPPEPRRLLISDADRGQGNEAEEENL